jgi:hypothetical protein
MAIDAEEDNMEEIQHMRSDGTLAAEIQRKTAEIDDWPTWAKPYEGQSSPAPSQEDQRAPQSDQQEPAPFPASK